MATHKKWYVRYFAGNTGRQYTSASSPQTKKTALEDASTIAGNNWQVWVEDEQGNTIFDNRKEEE